MGGYVPARYGVLVVCQTRQGAPATAMAMTVASDSEPRYCPFVIYRRTRDRRGCDCGGFVMIAAAWRDGFMMTGSSGAGDVHSMVESGGSFLPVLIMPLGLIGAARMPSPAWTS